MYGDVSIHRGFWVITWAILFVLGIALIGWPRAGNAQGIADTDSGDGSTADTAATDENTIPLTCGIFLVNASGPPTQIGYVQVTDENGTLFADEDDVTLFVDYQKDQVTAVVPAAAMSSVISHPDSSSLVIDIYSCGAVAKSGGVCNGGSGGDDAKFVTSCLWGNALGDAVQPKGPAGPQGKPGDGGGTSDACEESVKVVLNGKTLVEAVDPRCFCRFDIEAETWFRWKARYTEISTKTDSKELKDNLDAKVEPADLFLDTDDGRMEWGTSAQKFTGGRNTSNNANIKVKAQGFDLNSDITLERSWDFPISASQGYIRPTQQVVNVHKDESETMFLVSVSPQECEIRAEFDIVGESRAKKVVSIAESNLNGRHNEHPEKHFSGAYTQGSLSNTSVTPTSNALAVVQEKDGRKHWLEKRSTLGAGGETEPGRGLRVKPDWVEVLKSLLEKIPILGDIISVINSASDYLAIDFAKAGQNHKIDPQGGKQPWKWHDKEWTQVWIINSHIAGTDVGAYDLLKWGTKGDQTAIARTNIEHEMTIDGKLRTGARTSDIKDVLRITVKPDADDVIEVGKRKFTIVAPPITVAKVNSATGVRWREVNTDALEILKGLIQDFNNRVKNFPAAGLSVILSQAGEKIEINDLEAAVGMLKSFIKEIEADQRKDKPQIDPGDAYLWINAAKDIIKKLDQF